MTDDSKHSIKGDRALISGGQDRLGFRDVAKQIVISLVDRASEDGLVIGVEGAWGSGKSSLLFLIREELEMLSEDRRPSVIDFRPWLIGDRDVLIANLFGELSSQLDQIALRAGDATPISVSKAKEAGETLRSFLKGVSRVGTFVEFVGTATGIGPVELVGKGVKALGESVGEKALPHLSELKDKLTRLLRELGHRFIVTIDDVDRLEPKEVIEVLRLVRSVVDLPNIIYLLCYDGQILAHSIEVATQVESGEAYLEKIVQLTVMVPKPEPLQLRQWFADELQTIAAVKDEEELTRLKSVIDFEGGRQLRTPRSVVRVLDAIRFIWPPLREAGADLADLVWLQLIKDGNPKLYRWIEEYCNTAVVTLGTARVEEAEKAKELKKLLACAGHDHFDDVTYRYAFAEQLPGVEIDYLGNNSEFKLFASVSDHQRDKAIQKRRLSSPDHYRLYFALAAPSHTLSIDRLSFILKAALTDSNQLGIQLLELHAEGVGGSLTKADFFLERIKSGAQETLTSQQCKNLLIALSQIMDEAYRREPSDQFFASSIWDRAQRLIPLLLSQLQPEDRSVAIATMFREGAAIGWLTSLFRHEIFAHGRYGDRESPPDNWLFTDAELDQITELMLARYRAMSTKDVFQTPNPISLLFAWRQGGDEEGPRQLIESNIISDENFIETLEGLTSRINSSNRGRLDVLKKENLAPFMDYEAAVRRIQSLQKDPELGDRAKRLAAAVEDDTEF